MYILFSCLYLEDIVISQATFERFTENSPGLHYQAHPITLKKALKKGYTYWCYHDEIGLPEAQEAIEAGLDHFTFDSK